MKIGYTCGVFDLLHVGHLNLLERAKEHCDYLIVGVCSDEYVRVCKGKEAVIGECDRTRLLAALKCVDKAEIVSIDETYDKMLAWKRFGFNVLFSGSDWKGTAAWNEYEKQLAEINCDVVYFDHTDGISSTILRERINR